ncbi:MAG: thioredoxin family protein [Acholeplasmataceae bacterium]
MITHLNHLNYNREVTQNKKKVIILFSAPWCLACQELLPLYEKWADEYHEEYDFKVCDMSKNKFLVNKFDVVTTLTFIVIDGKNVLRRFVGMQTDETFKYFMER